MKADGRVALAGRPQRDILIAAAVVLLAALLVITAVGPTSARFFDAALQPAELRQRGDTEGLSGPVVAAASHGSLPVTAALAPVAGRDPSAPAPGRTRPGPRASGLTATRFTALDPGAVFVASSTLDASIESSLFAASLDDSSTLTYSLNATTDGELTDDSSGLLALASETEDAQAGEKLSPTVERRAPALRDGAAAAKPRPKAKAPSNAKVRVVRGKSATARPVQQGVPANRPAARAHHSPSQRSH